MMLREQQVWDRPGVRAHRWLAAACVGGVALSALGAPPAADPPADEPQSESQPQTEAPPAPTPQPESEAPADDAGTDETPPADADPAPDAEPPAEPPAEDALPSLDELLGLDGLGGEAEAGGDPDATDLTRVLSGRDIPDAFGQAVSLMTEAAERLGEGEAHDVGIGTQRVQEDVIRRLDQLIESLQQQQQSSSSQQQQQQQQDQQSQRQPGQQRRPEQQQNATGDNRDERLPPARQDGAMRPIIDGEGAAWGALPARIRDMLVQGAGDDRFSAMYEAMTEAYYRRLAEQQLEGGR